MDCAGITDHMQQLARFAARKPLTLETMGLALLQEYPLIHEMELSRSLERPNHDHRSSGRFQPGRYHGPGGDEEELDGKRPDEVMGIDLRCVRISDWHTDRRDAIARSWSGSWSQHRGSEKVMQSAITDERRANRRSERWPQQLGHCSTRRSVRRFST